jgi:hypothetical protein
MGLLIMLPYRGDIITKLLNLVENEFCQRNVFRDYIIILPWVCQDS